MMTKQEVRITNEINPHFYGLWWTKCPYIIAKGGRGSFKSSVISLRLVVNMLNEASLGHKANIICIRENAAYLRDTVFNQISWAIEKLGVADKFIERTSPLRIIHNRTGSAFYFYGADKPLKLKSNTVPNIIDLWFEEAANVKNAEVFDQTIPTFIRNKSPFIEQVQVWFSYNPPRNPYDWVNEWVSGKENDPDYFVDTSNYLDDELGFTTDQQMKLIEKYKVNDPDYYRWLYLGEVIGLGTNVYNMKLFHIASSLPDDEYLLNLYFSADTGHEVSATTCGAYGLTNKGNVYLLDTYYYSPEGKSNKKAPSDLSRDLYDFIQRVCGQYGKSPTRMTIDSAEGALDNQFYKDYGVHWHKVHKLTKADMVDRVQDLLAQGRFFYLDLPANEVFIKEHQRYQWDEKTLQSDKPEVIKVADHTCDNFQYFALDNERELGLRW